MISDEPLMEHVPLYRDPKSEEIITQYPMGPIEKLGLLKMDFLGLRTLTVIANTVRLIEESRGLRIDPERIPLDDAKTYQLLADARTFGVFQLESTGMRNALRQLRPERLEDVIAMVALYRPGPMEMIPDFIARRHGRVKPTYEHPVMEKHLQETYGIMVYQEQVLKIANDMAGFSMSEADDLRKAMGKKIAALMAEQRAKFLAGAKGRGVKEKVAERVFELMEKFAGYGFNKAHATAYGIVAYQTAYFKANYPVEFMAALLTSEMANTDKVVVHMDECRAMGIGVLPPDVNVSRFSFGVDGETIRFGLGAIKNLGQKAIEIDRGLAGARRAPSRRWSTSAGGSTSSSSTGGWWRAWSRPAPSTRSGARGPSSWPPSTAPSRPASGTSASATRARSPCSTSWAGRRGPRPSSRTSWTTRSPSGTPSSACSTRRRSSGSTSRATRSGASGIAPSGWASWAPGSSPRSRTARASSSAGSSSALREINTKNGNRMGFATIEDVEGTIEVTMFPELFRQSAAHLRSGAAAAGPRQGGGDGDRPEAPRRRRSGRSRAETAERAVGTPLPRASLPRGRPRRRGRGSAPGAPGDLRGAPRDRAPGPPPPRGRRRGRRPLPHPARPPVGGLRRGRGGAPGPGASPSRPDRGRR